MKAAQTVESALGVHTSEFTIYECPHCGLRFQSAPSGSAVDEFYGADYHHRLLLGHAAESRVKAAKREGLRRIRHLKQYCPRGKVLDVGCSTGLFASLLQDHGFAVTGLDVSEDACAQAREVLGDNVYCGRVEDQDLIPECSFDAVTLLDVIEHFDDPVAPLRAIHRRLKPGGILFLRTPTLRSPFFRLADWSYTLTRGRFSFAVLKIYHAEHLFFFQESNLVRLLEDVGFEILELAPDPLLWENFRAAELNYGFPLNSALAALYLLGRGMRRGHGVRVVARKVS